MLTIAQNSKNKVFIIHCENADPEQHWYGWLERQLASDEIGVKRIFLADARYPDANIWHTCLEFQLRELNEQSIVIAHGLSCVAVAHFLAHKLKQTAIKASIFIAGFNEPISSHPEFDSFLRRCSFESGVLRAFIQRRLVFFSNNAPIVPIPLTFKFSHLLNAQLIEAGQAGHFRQEDGYSEFPQLLQVLQTLVRAELS